MILTDWNLLFNSFTLKRGCKLYALTVYLGENNESETFPSADSLPAAYVLYKADRKNNCSP